MELKVKRIHKDAKLPTYGTEGAACFDLYACHPRLHLVFGNDIASETIGTGLSFEVPADHVMLIFSRSGHGFNHDVRLANCVGVIDSDYRGEVAVRLTADHNNNPLAVVNGDRIAQAMVIPVQQVSFNEVDELSETVRGACGFGSTGA